MFRPNATSKRIKSGEGVKFHEFLRWILYLESAKMPLCEHWCPLQWRNNECNGVSNHQRLNCLLKSFFSCRSNKTSKLRDTGPCEGTSPATGGFLYKGPVSRNIFFHLITSLCHITDSATRVRPTIISSENMKRWTLKQAYHVKKYPVSRSDQQRKTGVDGSITAAYFNNVSTDDEKK